MYYLPLSFALLFPFCLPLPLPLLLLLVVVAAVFFLLLLLAAAIVEMVLNESSTIIGTE